MNEIIRITVLLGNSFKSYNVGQDGVKKIIDESIEFESRIEFIYIIKYIAENKVTRIENCSVIVDYE